MVNTNMLRAQMTLHGYTIEKLSQELGISSKTLWTRLSVSPEKFTQKEIQELVKILKIKKPMDIFFDG